MRVLVTGASGQLGRSLERELDGHDAVMLPRAALDVTDPVAVEGVIRSAAPDVIVHAAAWTDVDGCELDPERARIQNVLATQNVAEAAGPAYVIVVSTDYVFDGASDQAYVETDQTNPLQVYGKTKLEAEQVALASAPRVAVARTAWLYGPGGKNFVTAIVGAAEKGEPFDVVDDQVGSPTSTPDLARALVVLAVERATGVFHVANSGAASRFEFARAIVRRAGLDEGLVRPVATERAPQRPARRPLHAPIDGKAWRGAGLEPLAAWDDALARALPDILAAR